MDFRTIAFGLGVFFATFLVGWWFNIGNLVSLLARPPSTQGMAIASPGNPQAVTAPNVWEGKGLTDNQQLRDAVVSWARAYQRPACDQDVRWGYVNAASQYAEVLMRAAGCRPNNCELTTAQLERVWLANR